MKRFWLPLGIALIFTLGAPIGGRVPFEMRIVSEDSGAGVPDLRVTTDNGLVCRTQRGTGACFWWAPSLLDRSVSVHITDDSYRFDDVAATLNFTAGGQAILTIRTRT